MLVLLKMLALTVPSLMDGVALTVCVLRFPLSCVGAARTSGTAPRIRCALPRAQRERERAAGWARARG